MLLFLVKRWVGAKFLKVRLESWHVADEHIRPLLHIAARGSVYPLSLIEEELDSSEDLIRPVGPMLLVGFVVDGQIAIWREAERMMCGGRHVFVDLRREIRLQIN